MISWPESLGPKSESEPGEKNKGGVIKSFGNALGMAVAAGAIPILLTAVGILAGGIMLGLAAENLLTGLTCLLGLHVGPARRKKVETKNPS